MAAEHIERVPDQGRFSIAPESSPVSGVLPIAWLPDSVAIRGNFARMGTFGLCLPAAECQCERCLDSLPAVREPDMAELLAHDGWTHQQSARVDLGLLFPYQRAGHALAPEYQRSQLLHSRECDKRSDRWRQYLRPAGCVQHYQGTAHDQCRRRNLSRKGPPGNAAE